MFLRSQRVLKLSLFAAASALSGLISIPALGATAFPELSQQDFDNVIREFSASTNYHSATPASSMGSIFGVEFGVVAGGTNTPETDKLVGQASPGSGLSVVPHAGILAAITTPIAVTIEGVYLPSISQKDLKIQNYGIGVKWTPTDSLFLLPINLSLRGFMTKTEFSFEQQISGGNGTVTYDGQVTGLQILASPKIIPMIEPYAGFGLLNGKGKLSVTGTAGDIFQFTNSQSAESSPASTQFLIGADIRLLLIGFGVEYSRAFNTDSYTGKFSLKF